MCAPCVLVCHSVLPACSWPSDHEPALAPAQLSAFTGSICQNRASSTPPRCSCHQRRSCASPLLLTNSTCQTCFDSLPPRLLPSSVGPSGESTAKKSKPGLAPGPVSAYNPADSSELPSWITERVRICQRLAPEAPPSPHPAPPPHPPAPALQHQQQQQPSSAAPHDSNGSRPEFVLYWMRTALRGHENPALVCALLTPPKFVSSKLACSQLCLGCFSMWACPPFKQRRFSQAVCCSLSPSLCQAVANPPTHSKPGVPKLFAVNLCIGCSRM